jgi:hypothetical protein
MDTEKNRMESLEDKYGDDRIVVIASKMIKEAITDFSDTICRIKHEEVTKVEKNLSALIKLNATLLIGVIVTLVAVLMK